MAMAVTKITPTPGDISFSSVLATFASGKLYVGAGQYDQAGADAAYATQLSMATELSTNLDEITDMAEKPGKIESKAEKLKTKNYLIDGKRSTTITLNVVGMSQARKDWMEQHLNESNMTIVLQSTNETDVMVFNGLRWVFDWSEDIDGLFNGVISTEFAGKTEMRVMIYDNIPEA